MKNEINAVLENMTTTIPEPEDYTGEDGLLSVSYTHLPSSGTDVKLTLWIRPATWIFWRRCTALWLF